MGAYVEGVGICADTLVSIGKEYLEVFRGRASACENAEDYIPKKIVGSNVLFLEADECKDVASSFSIDEWKSGNLGLHCEDFETARKLVSVFHHAGVAMYGNCILKDWLTHDVNTVYFCQYDSFIDAPLWSTVDIRSKRANESEILSM